MFWLLVIVVAVIVIAVIIKGNGYWAAKTRNNIISWATNAQGNCCECKHCRKDDSGRFSNTGYYCALSKCENITESTVMNCFEKPKITEEDLKELFSLGIWNESGKRFIRANLLGKAMTWTEINNYLKQLPIDHPEFINRDSSNRYL